MKIPKKNIEHMLLVKKKFLAEFLKRKKKIEQPYKPGRGKGFCVMRDGPKSSCESHDTGLDKDETLYYFERKM